MSALTFAENEEYEVWRRRFAQRRPFAISVEVTRCGGMRGAEFIFPVILSGNGFGPFYEDTTGHVFLDLISSIGVHILGCAHPVLKCRAQQTPQNGFTMQTHLFPQKEYAELIGDLTALAVERLSLDRCWLTPTGASALETGLQIALACHPPKKRKILTFRETYFANWAFKRAAFLSSPVSNLKFLTFPKKGDAEAVRQCLTEIESMSQFLNEDAGAFVFEPFIAEGGFWNSDADAMAKILQVLKSSGVTIISDETQTFLKSPDVFASSKAQFKDRVDVVIIGKALQNAAVLFRRDLSPPNGILGGTFAGSTAALAAGREIIRFLTDNNFYGNSGRISQVNSRVVDGLQTMSSQLTRLQPVDIDSCGLMAGFSLKGATPAITMAIVRQLFAAGLLVSVCGQNPSRIRFHVPAIIQDREIDLALDIIRNELASAPAP